jgi:hypothetical protein
LQVPPGAERAVGLEDDAVAAARIKQAAPVLHGTELDLVDGRRDAARGDDLVEVGRAEVRHADRPGQATLLCPLHAGPGPYRPALRPVHQVEVHLVDAEPP